MKVSSHSKILVLNDNTKGANGYQFAFGCVPDIIKKMYGNTIVLNVENLVFDNFKKEVKDFEPDLIFCYLQKVDQINKMSSYLKEYHPVPVINWFLEDPNSVVNHETGENIIDATASFDFWFSQDSNMQKFWKTKSAFMPPGFNESAYSDLRLSKIYDISYIGQLGPKYVAQMYMPYMEELARYGKNAILCIDRPMGIPLLPKPLEKFIRSKKRRKFLQSLPFWKCRWYNPVDEREKCKIINQSKIHFGMVRVRGLWEESLKKLLPEYPLDNTGLFYQPKGRLFQGAASGAMMFNEYFPELENLFEIGKEIITFNFGNIDEVREKLKYYLKNEIERKEVAWKGYKRVKECHTFRNRLEQIFDYIKTNL